jgi:hypothetical protein
MNSVTHSMCFFEFVNLFILPVLLLLFIGGIMVVNNKELGKSYFMVMGLATAAIICAGVVVAIFFVSAPILNGI